MLINSIETEYMFSISQAMENVDWLTCFGRTLPYMTSQLKDRERNKLAAIDARCYRKCSQ